MFAAVRLLPVAVKLTPLEAEGYVAVRALPRVGAVRTGEAAADTVKLCVVEPAL